MTYHTIWPEGLPLKEKKTRSTWGARWIVLKFQLHYLFRLSQTRRIRHVTTVQDYCDPFIIERQLKEIGAIPPPGGWNESPEYMAPSEEDNTAMPTKFDAPGSEPRNRWQPPITVSVSKEIVEHSDSKLVYIWPHCAPLKIDEENCFTFMGVHYRKEFIGDHWEYVIDVIKPDFKELFDDLRNRILSAEEYLVVQQILAEFKAALFAQDQLRINAAMKPDEDRLSRPLRDA